MKTVLKNISFCLFSLFLITNIFMFTSCGNGNRNDEPIEKEDQCTYCQDEQYDNSCIDGSECGGKTITDERLHTIGNGNYQFYNFMYTSGMMEEKVASTLNDAQSYMNVMMGNFKESLNENSSAKAYFADYIDQMEKIKYVTISPTGFDGVIYKINEYSKPICVDIVKNISSPLNQKRMIRYYEAMTIQAKEEGYGDNFNADAQQECEEKKSEVIRKWNGAHRVTGTQQPFDLGADMDNGFMQITEEMDTSLAEAARNMGIPLEILRKFVNQTFVVEGLDVVHDLYSNIDSHKSCTMGGEVTIVEAMDEAAPLN